MQNSSVGGLHIQYYGLCKRKLWLYDKGIGMEEESDRVLQGTVLHESAYPRLKQKEILIDNAFQLDAIDGEYIREVKLSSKMIESDKLQMLFYLYQLSLRGIEKKGLISYTKEKQTVEVILTDENRQMVKKAITEAYNIIEESSPPALKKLPYCKLCAYYGFCYAMEVEHDDA